MTVHTATEAPSRPGVAASVVDATKVYGTGATQVRALDHVTLDFATGQFTTVMGPSGSGRSTLPHPSPAWTPSPRAAHSSAGPTWAAWTTSA
jgi:putative ABC transport system ATP-binding protein